MNVDLKSFTETYIIKLKKKFSCTLNKFKFTNLTYDFDGNLGRNYCK